MKLIFLIILIFIIDLYFFLSTVDYFNIDSKGKSIYTYIYWFISVSIYLILIYLILYAKETANTTNFNNNIKYSSLFFIFFFSKLIGCGPLILDDLIRLTKIIIIPFKYSNDSFNLSRLEFLRNSAIIIASSIATTMLLGIKFGRYNFKKNITDIFINNWPNKLEDYKIIHISDLHLGSFNSVEKLEEVVSTINKENADLLVFTGDLVNNYYHEANPYINTLKKLKSKDGKFSVLGNHDYCDYVGWKRKSYKWKNNFNNFIKLQKEIGFKLLMNESVIINDNQYNLVGVENWGGGNFNKDGDLDKAMQKVDDSLPTILLSHDPSHWRQVVLKSQYNIDLQLSGHTHGMQFGIEIPGFKWSPVKLRYKEWAGLYHNNEKQIYVNRGLGHLGYAGRVGIMPDISILNIKSNV